MMKRRMKRKFHVRCEAGENLEITSKSYLSLSIAFGDGVVDIPMFKACGFSVAMGNGNDEVKQAASYVTDDVDQDGLYNAFKYLKLI